MSRPRRGAAALAALVALVAACARGSAPGVPEAPATRPAALVALARCAFDALPVGARAAAVEAALRTALRRDRYAFAVRAGRCASALSPELRARDARARELADAWDALLPLAQAGAPDDIALERAVRHVGNAWRDAE